MSRENLINAILSMDVRQIRKEAGKFDGVPVLCYIEDGIMKTYDKDGNPMKMQLPRERTPEAWEAFLIDYNVLFFNSSEEMESFLVEGRPMPRHTYKGLPPWVWLVKE